ncbi:MAG: alginate lyase family protein [Anaerolineales bacterium]|nr:alginate lyase family protein [Anaerolineales bacterium]
MPTLKRLLLLPKMAVQLGPLEIILYGLYKLGLLTGIFKRLENRGFESRKGTHPPLPDQLLSLPTKEQILAAIGAGGLRELTAAADEIAAGCYRPFGGEPVELNLAPEGPLHHWTAYETGKMRAVEGSPLGDIKFIWEPARFGWAFALGRAYHLTADEKYARAFWEYTETFLDGHPAYLGPHWMNGQEVAIRMMALVWAAQVFAPSGQSTAARRQRLGQSIAAHAERIPLTLLYARAQNNNHLVSEAAGLYTAGLALPDHPRAQKWRQSGQKWLNWCFSNQISHFGEYLQHSTNYHRLMLQTALWVVSLTTKGAKAHNGQETHWPSWLKRKSREKLSSAAHWLFSLLDTQSGQAPNLGANDGAYLFPLTNAPGSDYRPVIQAAARAFLKIQMDPGPWDEMSLWFGLEPVEKIYQADHYLSQNLRGKRSWAYLRASKFKSRLGHIDQLHLDLWWRGLNVTRDAGTYAYNAAPPWDNPWPETRFHNTVTVNARNQMLRAGRFMTLDWVEAVSESLLVSEPEVLQCVRAVHEGYRSAGVRHQRTVKVCADERWEVVDVMRARDSRKKRTFRLHWLLPDWEWGFTENSEERTGIGLESPFGPVMITIQTVPFLTTLSSLLSVVRGGEYVYGSGEPDPVRGWISPTYGVRLPALSLAVEVASTAMVKFTSEFRFPS